MILLSMAGGAAMIGSGFAHAREKPISVKSSFRVGTEGVLCTAQYSAGDKRLIQIFDRAYKLVCRDAAGSVGSLLALRTGSDDPAATLLDNYRKVYQCSGSTSAQIENLGAVETTTCRDADLSVDRNFYRFSQGDTVFVAEGLAGYDSVLRLGLKSLVNDRSIPGRVEVASTNVSDPAAFARIQAGNLDSGTARTEAYRRNSIGSYAEAAEFFETLLRRQETDSRNSAEFLANQALQQSNLGSFPTADDMFAKANQLVAANDGVTQRMIRNFQAIHFLNQQRTDEAITALGKSVPPAREDYEKQQVESGLITQSIADQINRENRELKRLGGVDNNLRPQERAQILDGQARLIKGMAFRIQGEHQEALDAIASGLEQVAAVRDGRVLSINWLQAEMLAERALIYEAQGNVEEADVAFTAAVARFERSLPQSPAFLSAMARYAGFLERQGQIDAAIALFDRVVEESSSVSGSSATIRRLIAPYFKILAAREDDPKADEKMFKASQLLERPGVAQTQAILARELSQNDSEAAALFRLSIARSRSIISTIAEIDRFSAIENPSEGQQARLATAQAGLTHLQEQQTAIQSQLAEYSQYRILSPARLELEELQALLSPNEAYYKVSIVGEQVYAQFITSDSARSISFTETASDIDKTVAYLRDSIVTIENGQPTTYPFNVALSRQLYLSLFGEIEEELSGIQHLIYEPDGALLQLPPGLLISQQADVDAYQARVADPDTDAFDFSKINWLARDLDISIAVSEKSFRDIRKIPAAKGSMAYLGLGTNAPTDTEARLTKLSDNNNCNWPLSTWANPISSDELNIASQAIGRSRSNVITGADFSDSALLAQNDLSDYRIIHFATHGLVTAPKPHCPARPALLTSFGDDKSDGLLSFKEIFDLRLDADLVILSACDTAGLATVEASREAGIATGGNYALDGLVRAFIGAGARSVLASHWPVPDDYDATKTLMSGLFDGEKGASINSALNRAQKTLMDDPLTSHPYYWAAFVLLGDGTRPLQE